MNGGVLVDKLGFSGELRRTKGESFRPPFSKGGASQGRGALVASAEAKLPYRSKAPRKGEFSPKAKRGKTHKWGFSLSIQRLS